MFLIEGLRKFEKIEQLFKDNFILPRFDSAISKPAIISEIPAFDDEIERRVLLEVEELLQKKVFLDFSKPITNQTNRRIFQQLLPDAEKKFREMEDIGKTMKQLDNPGSNDGKGKKGKLEYAYDLLFCAWQLCEQFCEPHRSSVQAICSALSNPSLLQGTPSSIVIVNEIMEPVHNQEDSLWASMNKIETGVKKAWVRKVHDRIKFKYLEVFEAALKKNYRTLLVENIAARPFQVENWRTRKGEKPTFWLCTSLDQLSKDLVKRLVKRTMDAPIDVARAMEEGKKANKADAKKVAEIEASSVRCYVNGNEVQPESNSPIGRYKAYLRAIGGLFDRPELFCDLAKIMEFPMKDEQNMQTDYPKSYEKLMAMNATQKEELRKEFVEWGYASELFDTALKYFIVFQNVLDQATLYYYNRKAMDAKWYKMTLDKKKRGNLGLKKLKEDSEIKKNEFVLRVNGTRCEITVIRHDCVFVQDVILRQEFKLIIDIEKDVIIPPVKDDISMSITCPSNIKDEPEIRSLLWELPLAMESLGFNPLQTIITKPTV